MPNNSLMHFGVLGMRWGHRKAQETSSNKFRSDRHHPDHDIFIKSQKTKISNLSDDELRAVNRRITLLSSLNKINPALYDFKHTKRMSNSEIEAQIRREKLKELNATVGITKSKKIRQMTDAEVKAHLDRAILEKPAREYKRNDTLMKIWIGGMVVSMLYNAGVIAAIAKGGN